MTHRVSRPQNGFKTFLRLLSYFKGKNLALFILCILLSICCSISYLLGTYFLKDVVDIAIAKNDMTKLVYYIVLIASIYGLGVFSNLTYTQLIIRVSQNVIYNIRQDLFSHTQKLPMRFFDKKTHGQIMTYFTNDVDTLNNALNDSLVNIVFTLCNAVGTIVFMLILNVYLSLIVIFFLTIMGIFMIINMKKCRKYYSLNQNKLSDMNGFIEESINGIKEEKIFEHQEENLNVFKKHNNELKNIVTKAFFHTQLNVPVIVALSYFNFAISAVVGSFFAVSNLISYGVLSSYLVYVRQSAQPFNFLINHTNVILNALAGCERIFTYLDEPIEEDDGTVVLVNAKYVDNQLIETSDYTGIYAWKDPINDRLILLKGDIRFNNVTFSYNENKKVLNDINFYAKPGQKIAFVGSTGAGKTTIINLLTRLYEIQNGEILYDGINIKNIKKVFLRRSVSIVSQDTHLFYGTILDNIRFSRKDASISEVEEALRLSNANKFIKHMKDGYNTIISDGGSNLSQGQRQLLSIARAMVSRPPVLILDEATSNIDTRTEKLIQKGMDNLMQNRTVLVIAHRLSTIIDAQAILLLEHGKVIERGIHTDLINQKGEYYSLYTGKSELS